MPLQGLWHRSHQSRVALTNQNLRPLHPLSLLPCRVSSHPYQFSLMTLKSLKSKLLHEENDVRLTARTGRGCYYSFEEYALLQKFQ